MEIILLERIARLGDMGDVVNVKNGYARNFLLPQGKALRANKANLEYFESQRAELEARNEARKKEAGGVAAQIDGTSYVAIRQASESGQLYGSVSTRDIAGMVAESGFQITRNSVKLPVPIKTLGLHEVMIDLHPEIETRITINVARSEDEAVRQARGEDVTATQDDVEEEELVPDVEELFEDEEVAREAATELAEDLEETTEVSEADEAEATAEAATEAPVGAESEEEKS